MRRFVIDNNQVTRLTQFSPPNGSPKQGIPIVISDFIALEILASESRDRMIAGLQNYQILFGLPKRELLASFCTLSPDKVATFDPIHPIGSDGHFRELKRLAYPSPDRIEAAKSIKIVNGIFSDALIANDAANRAPYKSGIADGTRKKLPPIASIKEFEEILESADSLRWCARVDLRDYWLSEEAKESTVSQMLKNACYRRYLLYAAVLTGGHAQRFANPRLKRLQISHNRVDLPDNHLALYARDGDVVVSEDNAVRDVFEFISRGTVSVMTWEKCMATYFAV